MPESKRPPKMQNEEKSFLTSVKKHTYIPPPSPPKPKFTPSEIKRDSLNKLVGLIENLTRVGGNAVAGAIETANYSHLDIFNDDQVNTEIQYDTLIGNTSGLVAALLFHRTFRNKYDPTPDKNPPYRSFEAAAALGTIIATPIANSFVPEDQQGNRLLSGIAVDYAGIGFGLLGVAFWYLSKYYLKEDSPQKEEKVIKNLLERMKDYNPEEEDPEDYDINTLQFHLETLELNLASYEKSKSFAENLLKLNNTATLDNQQRERLAQAEFILKAANDHINILKQQVIRFKKIKKKKEISLHTTGTEGPSRYSKSSLMFFSAVGQVIGIIIGITKDATANLMGAIYAAIAGTIGFMGSIIFVPLINKLFSKILVTETGNTFRTNYVRAGIALGGLVGAVLWIPLGPLLVPTLSVFIGISFFSAAASIIGGIALGAFGNKITKKIQTRYGYLLKPLGKEPKLQGSKLPPIDRMRPKELYLVLKDNKTLAYSLMDKKGNVVCGVIHDYELKTTDFKIIKNLLKLNKPFHSIQHSFEEKATISKAKESLFQLLNLVDAEITESSWDYNVRSTEGLFKNIGASIGALIGLFTPIPGGIFAGALIGGAIGGVLGWVVGFYSGNKIRDTHPKEVKSNTIPWSQRMWGGTLGFFTLGSLLGLAIGSIPAIANPALGILLGSNIGGMIGCLVGVFYEKSARTMFKNWLLGKKQTTENNTSPAEPTRLPTSHNHISKNLSEKNDNNYHNVIKPTFKPSFNKPIDNNNNVLKNKYERDQLKFNVLHSLYRPKEVHGSDSHGKPLDLSLSTIHETAEENPVPVPAVKQIDQKPIDKIAFFSAKMPKNITKSTKQARYQSILPSILEG